MEADIGIKRSVLEMYMAHPFPQWSKEMRHTRLAQELCRYRFLGLEQAMKGARFLDVGCGTANRSMLVAKHFEVSEYVGVDHSSASLEIARRVADEEGFDRFTPVEGDLFEIPYPDGSFDIVVSWGVLHHTADPKRGLREMVRLCRPGGFVGLFLYNKWNHWRHNLQKDKVSRLAGPDFEERFRVAHRLYGRKPVEEMTPEEIALFYDQYCHPHKSDHTFGETLSWFDELGLTYWGSCAPLRLIDAISCLQYRHELAREYPYELRKEAILGSWASRLPRLSVPEPPFPRPTRLDRFLRQALLVWRGRYGSYSDGSALSARKPEH